MAMSRFDDIVPPHIRALGGYTPGKPLRTAERESGIACIKLASNENPLGPSPLAVDRRTARHSPVSVDRCRANGLGGGGSHSAMVALVPPGGWLPNKRMQRDLRKRPSSACSAPDARR